MIQKEAIEAVRCAVEGECDGLAISEEQARSILEYALAAMPAQGVKALVPTQRVDQIVGTADPTEDEAHDMAVELMNWRRVALTPAPSLAAENERLRAALEFYSCQADNCDCVPGKENAESVWCGFRARKALEGRT